MAIKRSKRFSAEVHASSMSDIMFFLLLFFLILSTLANPNVIKVSLPKSKTNEKTSKQIISISVTEDKKYYIDKQEVTFESLEKSLMGMIDKSKEQTVVLRLPATATVQDFIDVSQIGVKNKLNFVLATSPQI